MVGVRVHHTDDTWLGLRCRQHGRVTVSVLSIRQGRVRVMVRVTARGRSGYPEGCAAARATGSDSCMWSPHLPGQMTTNTTIVLLSGVCGSNSWLFFNVLHTPVD